MQDSFGHRYYYGSYGPYYGRTPRNDEEIRSDIRDRLIWDSWVDADRVMVDVSRGVVTLRGEVDTVIEKRAAGDDAWDTPGVVDVLNEIRIRQPVAMP
jgi:osmotically-inducible protein OsmY